MYIRRYANEIATESIVFGRSSGLRASKNLGQLHVRRWWLLGKPLNRLSKLLMLFDCLTVNNIFDVIYVAVCSGQKSYACTNLFDVRFKKFVVF